MCYYFTLQTGYGNQAAIFSRKQNRKSVQKEGLIGQSLCQWEGIKRSYTNPIKCYLPSLWRTKNTF